jgi:O-antigen/teichoic acid export membrane protein
MKKILKKVRKRFFRKAGSDENVKEVLKGGSIAFVYRLATMAVSYGLIVFISRKLGSEGIGIYNLSLAFLGILVMVGCMGFNTSVVRFVSQYNAQHRHRHITRLFRAMTRITFPLSMLLAAAWFISAPYLAEKAYDDPELTLPFRIAALTLPFMVMGTINVEFIRGFKLVHVSELFRNLFTQLISIVGLIAISFIALYNHYPLIAFGIGWVLSAAYTTYFIYKVMAAKQAEVAGLEPEAEVPFSLKEHLIISLPMILTSFIQLINGKVDTVMIGFYESTAIVGVFSVAYKIADITNFALGALKTIAMPKISELFWSKRMEELNGMVQYSTRIIFYFSAPVCVVLFLFPEPVLALVNPDFVSGATTLRIFAATQVVNALSGMVAVFLNMTGNQVYFTKLVAITTTMNIALNALLIPLYGMEGAAIATFISVVSWNVTGALFIYRKYGISTFFNPFVRAVKAAK